MFKDLMKAILNEDVELDEEEYEEDYTPQQPVQEAKEEVVQPEEKPQVELYKEPVIETFAKPEVKVEQPVKQSIFSGLDVEEVSRRETNVKKPYKYDRRKMMKLRTSEEMDYNPVISPIFGNVEEDKKAFDKVHDAIKLPKPQEDQEFVQIISPMYGSNIPEAKPVESIPQIKPAYKKNEEESKPEETLSLSDMLEKPEKQEATQTNLFDLKD